MVTVKVHPAQRCQDDLAHSKAAWFDPKRFNIIKKWMHAHYWAVRDGEIAEPPRPELGMTSSEESTNG